MDIRLPGIGRGRRRGEDAEAEGQGQGQAAAPHRSGGAPAEPSAATADQPAPATQADELRARREEIARMEERALREAHSLELQRKELERRSQALDDRERNLHNEAEALKRAKRVQRRELERLSGLSAAQAKQMLLGDVESEARHQAGLTLRRIEEETKSEAERRARNILAVATQRLAPRHASETTTRTVKLPSNQMKGRVIGRDGRNIRALENLTGVDVIVDETPNTVTVSSFDGVRREIARVTLDKLVADGRITPARCEEMFAKAKTEVEESIDELGKRAALDAGVKGLAPELTRLLGRLHFRTSYGQNVLDHLVECAHLAGMMAEELGASVETARRAALLHDIGKAVTHEVKGPHALIAGKLARRYGEPEAVAHAMEAHHNEVEPRTIEAVIVQAADALSGARPGARGEALEQYVSRMRDLEEVAQRQPGVKRVHAMRAGHEIRVIVDPDEVDDDQAALLSHQIAAAIEQELHYPGQVKITVIRESRSTEYAT